MRAICNPLYSDTNKSIKLVSFSYKSNRKRRKLWHFKPMFGIGNCRKDSRGRAIGKTQDALNSKIKNY